MKLDGIVCLVYDRGPSSRMSAIFPGAQQYAFKTVFEGEAKHLAASLPAGGGEAAAAAFAPLLIS